MRDKLCKLSKKQFLSTNIPMIIYISRFQSRVNTNVISAYYPVPHIRFDKYSSLINRWSEELTVHASRELLIVRKMWWYFGDTEHRYPQRNRRMNDSAVTVTSPRSAPLTPGRQRRALFISPLWNIQFAVKEIYIEYYIQCVTNF